MTADNVESFLHLARTRGERRGLTDFLREIESLENAINLESDLSDKDQGNAVQVMTAHSAKGLEFPVTIVAAMDKGTQRNSAPVTFTPNLRPRPHMERSDRQEEERRSRRFLAVAQRQRN